MALELLSPQELRVRLQASVERAAVAEARERLLDSIWFQERHESPIEQLFAAAWRIAEWISTEEREIRAHLVPQHEISTTDGQRFRADFLAGVYLPYRGQRDSVIDDALDAIKVVIELDGHEFHERTKEQVESRNARDRALQADGYRVLHFAGSEVVRDPVACASGVLGPLLKDGEDAFYRALCSIPIAPLEGAPHQAATE